MVVLTSKIISLLVISQTETLAAFNHGWNVCQFLGGLSVPGA